MSAERALAWLGSFIGNTTLFGAIVAGWPGMPPCCPPDSLPQPGLVVVEMGQFTPYIMDRGFYREPGRHGPECPHPEADSWAFILEQAPLPSGFDPSAWPGRRLSACVRVDADGEVLGVTLVGVEQPALASDLIATIRRDWSFWRFDASGKEGWLRVGLNIGPSEISVPDYARE